MARARSSQYTTPLTQVRDVGALRHATGRRPTLKLWEAKQLAAQYRGERLKTRSIRAVLRERLRRLAEYFATNLADFRAEDLDLAEAQLTQVIQQIGAAKTAILDGSHSTSITPPGLLIDQPINNRIHV